jgi:4-diphosphocytidyl-2-C-methyl-D-erythritol kinase
MGGFEGGDEAGFWDIDTLTASIDQQHQNKPKSSNRIKASIQRSDLGYSIKAYAKGKELYDTIRFAPHACETFTIEGCDDIPLESNSIYKAYKALLDYTNDSDISDFFYEHKVVVTKGIPSQADLSGASSNAAAFILLVKEVCNLILSSDELAKIGSTVGAEVPFFIDNPSADI